MTGNDEALGPPRTKDKVLIVAAAHSSSILHAPLHLASSHELWCFNDLGDRYSHDTWDRYFELHTYEQFSAHTLPIERRGMLGAIAEAGAVVYLAEQMEGVQPWLPFPFDELCSRWPRGTYHCSSFDWLVQLAFELGFKEIQFSGMGDMSIEANEPRSSRGCLEYWIGVCEGEGVRVVLNEGTNVLRNVERGGGMYPMDEVLPQHAKDSEVRLFYRTVHELAYGMAEGWLRDWMAQGTEEMDEKTLQVVRDLINSEPGDTEEAMDG